MKCAVLPLIAVIAASAGVDEIAKQISGGEYRAALESLNTINAEYRNAEWHLLASKAWDGLNEPQKAVNEAQAAIALDPASEPARLQLAQIFLSRNTPEAAYEILSEALPQFPNSVLIRLGSGLSLNGMRRYDEAIARLKECLARKPDLGPAFDALGAAYLNKGSYEALIDAATSYSRGNPADFRGYYYAAAAREELRLDPRETEALVRRALSLNPNFAAAHALLGRVLLDLDRPQEAASALREAIRLRPDYTPAHLYLATALRRLGNTEEARREADEVARLNADESRPVPHLLYHRGSTNQK